MDITYDIYDIDDHQRQAIADSQDPTLRPYENFEEFLRTCRGSAGVSVALRARIDAFRQGQGAGALLIRGFPIPAVLQPTPVIPFAETRRDAVGTEYLVGTISSLLGEPFSYQQWDAGLLIHNKYPIWAHRDIQFGSNAVDFFMHTETPFRPVSPDFLALLCLRGDPTGAAKTRVSSLESAVAALTDQVRSLLRESAFAFLTDQPVLEFADRGMTAPHPVISGLNGSERLQYVEDLVGITESAQDALDLLRQEVQRRAADIALEAGQMLLLDNRRVVHGRNAFSPRYDGGDRWLQRMLISTTLFRDGVPAAGRLIPDSRFENYPTDYQLALRPAGAAQR